MVIGFRNDKGDKDKIFYPAELPILPLRGTVAYPDLVMPLIVGRERSIKLIDEVMGKDKIIGIITQKNPDIEDPSIEDLHTVGTIATIMKMVKMVDGSQRIVVLSLIHISEPTRLLSISYAVFCLKKKTYTHKKS